MLAAGLLATPLLTLALYLFLWLVAPNIDPGRRNYPRFAGPYTGVRIALVAFMAAIYGLVLLWIRGVEWSLGALMPMLLGVLFVIIGNVMGKVRPNWFVGCGLLWLASPPVHHPWAPVVPLLLLVAGSLGLTVYSYFLWRGDPDKVPPAGTDPS